MKKSHETKKKPLSEDELKNIVREEIKRELNETQQKHIRSARQFRNAVAGKQVKDATTTQMGGTVQYQIDFSNNETLLIQNPDKILFNEK